MPAPINYTAGFINPSDSIQQMLQMGGQLAQLGQFRDQRLASQQATEDARIAAEQKSARDAEIKGLYEQAIANPTWENYNRLAMLDPANSEKIIKTWGMVDTEQQQIALNESMRIFAGLTSGDPKAGLNLLEERRNAALNAKDEDSAKKYQSMIDMFNAGDKGPGMVAVTFGTTISGMPGGKDAMDAWATYRSSTREDAKVELDALKARLEAERPEGTKIDESARKMMNTAVETAMASDLLASQASNLADEFERAKPPGGYPAGALEAWKKMVGGQDQFTRLKQEYVKLRNTDVLKNLPPGVASDKDIEIALSAFPDESANPAQITAFLRGTAKLQQYSAAVNKAKAEWVNQNGSLGPAQIPFSAGGQDVKRGMAFWDFTKSIPVPNVIGKAVTTGGTAAEPEPVRTGTW